MCSIEGVEVKDGIENVRPAFQWAVSAVGRYVTPGDIIWEVYREFNDTFLGTLQRLMTSAVFSHEACADDVNVSVFFRQTIMSSKSSCYAVPEDQYTLHETIGITGTQQQSPDNIQC
ncbi:uncharacterized protein LOC143238420 isoform X4 [Tachypleus tridentatus]|uniref:uncharacterized protein LOC143238420 isoform X4 n=1 Tax=Tachypleus tridentatus TaxID=6853 RepID=UPI003FD40C73